ncbi:MAG: PAS domain S-box protein [Patescibacteria group bacterium]|nr:PAS domain S-box protein [Patescibacteria group bacterium]
MKITFPSDSIYAQAILDTVREPLIVLNEKFHIVTANRSFYKIFRVAKKETEHKLIFLVGNGQWNNEKLKHLLRDILPKKSWFQDFEIEHDFPTIGKRVMLLNARRLIQHSSNSPMILLAIEDITERKALDRQKDDFISIASHELKTPVTSIKIYGEILKKHPIIKKDKKASFLLTKMDQQLNRLNELVASFVNVYRVQTGKLKLHKTHFSIDNLVAETIGNFQYVVSEYSLIRVGEANVKVYADRDRINQVLVNLISNAIKYSPNSKNVEVIVSTDKKRVTIAVKDYGIGIPKDSQSKVFERFYRVMGEKEKDISGLGLGLYLSREIILQHNGNIWFTSEENKGTTFFFTLPLKR